MEEERRKEILSLKKWEVIKTKTLITHVHSVTLLERYPRCNCTESKKTSLIYPTFFWYYADYFPIPCTSVNNVSAHRGQAAWYTHMKPCESGLNKGTVLSLIGLKRRWSYSLLFIQYYIIPCLMWTVLTSSRMHQNCFIHKNGSFSFLPNRRLLRTSSNNPVKCSLH